MPFSQLLLMRMLMLCSPLVGLASQSANGQDLSRVYLPLISRYLPFVESSGILDTSFGQGGLVLTGLSAGDDFGIAMVVLRDGKLLVGGEVSSDYDMDLAVARYNPDGSLDAGFGSAGWTRTDLDGWDDYAAGIAVQPDGKILLAGTSRSDFVLVRYTADGSLDATFGSGWLGTHRFFGDLKMKPRQSLSSQMDGSLSLVMR